MPCSKGAVCFSGVPVRGKKKVKVTYITVSSVWPQKVRRVRDTSGLIDRDYKKHGGGCQLSVACEFVLLLSIIVLVLCFDKVGIVSVSYR